MGKGIDEKFCRECGQVIKAKAVICPVCGCAQGEPAEGGTGHAAGGAPVVVLNQSPAHSGQGSGANRLVAGTLAIFLGTFGVHKFYMGRPGIAVIYIIFSASGIPTLVGFLEGLVFLCQSDESFHRDHSR